MKDNNEKYKIQIRTLEEKFSALKFKLSEVETLLTEEQRKHEFYQRVADFTFGWELWFAPGGSIEYCSPSSLDLTGFTPNEVISSPGIASLLVYEPDRTRFNEFVAGALNQLIVNQSLDFRILTRHKQLSWFSMNVRGVYNKKGRYLGIRASLNDITRLKRAMGHIHELSTEKKLENRAKLRFKSELDLKDRELISFLLQLSQRNELISFTRRQLKAILATKTNYCREPLERLLETLEQAPTVPFDWDMVLLQLEKLHPGFWDRLTGKHSLLTLREKRLCAFIRLGLSSKEIAGLQNISRQGVEMARVRLRKKMKLTRQQRLSSYIEQI